MYPCVHLHSSTPAQTPRPHHLDECTRSVRRVPGHSYLESGESHPHSGESRSPRIPSHPSRTNPPGLELRADRLFQYSEVKVRGNRVSPSPCLWRRQPLPAAVGTWGNRVSSLSCLWGRQPLPTAFGTWGNRVSPPAVSLSNRTPAWGGASRMGGWRGETSAVRGGANAVQTLARMRCAPLKGLERG